VTRELPGFLQVGRPGSLLLAFPLREVLENVLASLDLMLAPRGPVKVLDSEAVSRLELLLARTIRRGLYISCHD